MNTRDVGIESWLSDTMRSMRRHQQRSPRGFEKGVWLAVALAVQLGCISVTTVNIGQKTSLERQLMGEFEPLTEQEILAASVRATTEIGPGSLDDLRHRAIAARRRQLFNRDDIRELKALGCLGEAPQAALVVRPCDAPLDTEAAARAKRLADEESQDRQAIVTWVLSNDPVLTPGDRPRVVRMLEELLRRQAQPSDWFLDEAGQWVQRSAM